MRAVLGCMNSYGGVQRRIFHEIMRSIIKTYLQYQIWSKNACFGKRKKNAAARAPLATTSNLYYRTFTYKEKKRKPTLNWSHIPTFNLHLFCPAWAWFIYASRGTRENFRNQISCRFRRVMIETSFPLFP